MSTYRLFVRLMVIALMGVIAITACAPPVASTPTPPTVASAPTTEILPADPTMPTPEASPALEVPPQEFRGHKSDLWGVAFSPDGKYLATGSNDRTARLWDLATGETIRLFSGHTGEVYEVVFSPDGKYLLTGSEDRTARLWDVASGETVQVFSGHTAGVEVGGFSPDGKYIVTAGGPDQTARLWDVASGQTMHVLSGHTDLVIRAAYSPDGKYVLTSSVDRTARLWDAATGSEVRVFDHPDVVGSIAFSPDGKTIATGGEDNVTRLWDVNTGELVNTFIGHTGFVQGVDFSPDGRFLLTGSADGTAQLWDLATGEVVRIFRSHRADVQTVTFSPDGSLIATASNDSVARVWNLQASSAGLPPQTASGGTLHLAVADQGGRPSEPYVLEFIEQVRTLSNGDITIEPIWEAGNATNAGFEVGVIQLVKTGQADLGLAASRAFDVESITSFQALQSPFLITNDALAKAVATSDISTRMLDTLSSAGIVGLTIWPEDLRHPFSIIPGKPILSPQDFAGLHVRATPSNVTYELLDALGATPTMDDSDYQAAESGLRQGASLTGIPTATGNVIFFAKFQVLFANGPAFEKLSEAQRAILHDAAIATQAKAIAEHPSEVEAATAWCASGGTVVMASKEQVAAFEVAAQPVFDMIAQNPLNVELIAAIRELKANTEPSPGAQACGPAVGQ
jgi:TRAP-type C4-dicarboxylate transport system substrate-binding protein